MPDRITPLHFVRVAEPAPAAALIGLDEPVAETIRLFLEILGWITEIYETIEDLENGAFRLVFVDEHQFRLRADTLLIREALPAGIVVVGLEPSPPDFGNITAKLHTLRLPLDISEIENIISEC